MLNRQHNEYPPLVPSQPKRDEIRKTNPKEYNITAAAVGSPIGVVYGEAPIAPLVFAVVREYTSLYLGLAWALGEIDGVVGLYDSEKQLGYTRTDYLGTLDQTADPDLSRLISGYFDTLVGNYMGEDYGIAYSVVRLGQSDAFNQSFQAVIRGRKVRDPRAPHNNARVYSNNPALCLADFIESTVLGLGKPVDDASLIAAADYCDELVGGFPRHTISLPIIRKANVDAHIETLRAYANCWVFAEGEKVYLVPMRVASSVGTLLDKDVFQGSMRVIQPPASNRPTVLTVEYTDKTSWPWGTNTFQVRHPQVDLGALPWRESRVQLPGIDNPSEAKRMATQRLNHATLVNMNISCTTFDESMQWQIGDVLDVTHDYGLAAKPMRLVGVNAASQGRWQMALEEYQPGIYSDEVATDPTWPDTGLMPVDQVPSPTGLTAAEVLFQADKGFWSSRLDISWNDIDDDYVYPRIFRVRVEALPGAGVTPGVVSENTTPLLTASSPPVQESVLYKVSVWAESTWGAETYSSAPATINVLAQGKLLPPGDVPAIRAQEAGGEVFIDWDESIDIDIWRYRLRYGAVGGDWDDGVLIDRVDAERHRTKDIPEGTWDIMIRAEDSVGNLSLNTTRTTVVVTFDPSNANKARYDYTDGAVLGNMIEIESNGERCWVTDGGTLWNDAFPLTMDNYTDPLATYTVDVTSSWTSEIKDWGQVIDGDWTMPYFEATLLEGGNPTREMQLEDTFDVWNNYPLLSAAGGFKRSRAYAAAGLGETLMVCIPVVRVEISANPKTQSGQDYFDGVSPTTISLAYSVHAITSIQITPTGGGASAASGVVDNVVIGASPSFDVYLFDAAGAMVAGNFFWEFRGI